jgi:hypothetical protein
VAWSQDAFRLFDLSRVLDVPISFFFDDLPEDLCYHTLNRRETLELVRAYYRIIDPAVRKRVFELMKPWVRRSPHANV